MGYSNRFDDSKSNFVVKDSGKRAELGNGFVRDAEDGKPDLTRYLMIPGLELIPVEMLERWGTHMLKGAEKYGKENWRKATGLAAKLRFGRSLVRHVWALLIGKRDEDHACAIMFNASAYELTKPEKGYGQTDKGEWVFVQDNTAPKISGDANWADEWLLCPGINNHKGKPCRKGVHPPVGLYSASGNENSRGNEHEDTCQARRREANRCDCYTKPFDCRFMGLLVPESCEDRQCANPAH